MTERRPLGAYRRCAGRARQPASDKSIGMRLEAFALIVFLSTGVVACGSDDDGSGGSSTGGTASGGTTSGGSGGTAEGGSGGTSAGGTSTGGTSTGGSAGSGGSAGNAGGSGYPDASNTGIPEGACPNGLKAA